MAKSNAFKLKFHGDAFKEIRNDHRVRADVNARAERIAERAASFGSGTAEGYVVTDLVLEDPRSAASVMATGNAHRHNRKYNALVRALDAGRG